MLNYFQLIVNHLKDNSPLKKKKKGNQRFNKLEQWDMYTESCPPEWNKKL